MRWVFRAPKTRDEAMAQLGFEAAVGISAFALAMITGWLL